MTDETTPDAVSLVHELLYAASQQGPEETDQVADRLLSAIHAERARHAEEVARLEERLAVQERATNHCGTVLGEQKRSSIDAPRGRMSVPPGPALRAVIYGLLTGNHWWLWDELDSDVLAHAVIPRSPDELCALVDTEDEWAPCVTVSDDAIRWEPWGISEYAYSRFIRIGYDGSVEWDMGPGRASTFVASVLVALGADPTGALIPATLEVWTLDGDRVRIAEGGES